MPVQKDSAQEPYLTPQPSGWETWTPEQRAGLVITVVLTAIIFIGSGVWVYFILRDRKRIQAKIEKKGKRHGRKRKRHRSKERMKTRHEDEGLSDAARGNRGEEDDGGDSLLILPLQDFSYKRRKGTPPPRGAGSTARHKDRRALLGFEDQRTMKKKKKKAERGDGGGGGDEKGSGGAGMSHVSKSRSPVDQQRDIMEPQAERKGTEGGNIIVGFAVS